ncbi:MAG: glycoside hydrolase family 10 protein [Planctomycetaceae bacterium]
MRLPLLLAVFFLCGSVSLQAGTEPPAAPREFRAVWVATLDNIDWPSRSGLSADQQRQEAELILDRLLALKMNAVILQVRSAADAIYPSKLEPWSRCLTGTPGKAPDPIWDPLQFWIEQAHRRGLELHAWLNPCRAHTGRGEPAATHIAKLRPDLVCRYGEMLWLDPGQSETTEHTLNVVSDLLQRYDLDGLHVDDYFYPYPVEQQGGQMLPFPDDDSWRLHRNNDPRLSRSDWRRSNVNRLVQGLWARVCTERPGIRFGISPFGIGRPGQVPGIRGFDQYEGIFADPEYWLQQGWCDYMAPQLYWSIDQPAQSFPVLLKFWQERAGGRIPIWPGLLTSRVGATSKTFSADEIPRQVELTRQLLASPGQLHFSMRTLQKNPAGLTDRLQSEVYSSAALAPVHLRAPGRPPTAPQVAFAEDGSRLRWSSSDSADARVLAVWLQVGDTWRFSVVPRSVAELPLPRGLVRCQVTAVSRTGLQSAPTELKIKARH